MALFHNIWALPVLLVFYIVYWQLTTGSHRRRLIRQHGCQPPRKLDDSFLGNIFSKKALNGIIGAAKQGKLLEHIQNRYAEIGYTHSAKVFHQDWLYTADPENLKTMLATNFEHFSMPDNRLSSFVPLLGYGIFTTDGPHWRFSRELLRPNFVKSQVGDLATFEEHISYLIKAIPQDGMSVVDIQALFFRLTMDSSTEFLFGKSTNTLLHDGTGEASMDVKFAAALERSQEEIARASRVVFYEFSKPKQFKDDVKLINDYVDQFVRRGLQLREKYAQDPEQTEEQSNGGRYVFLDELVKRISDPVRIRSELLNILIAGRDTTASLLGNLWFMLARHPEVWKKLQDEVGMLNGQPPTYEELKNMKYLRACINESLRLTPVIPLNSRMAAVDTVLPLGGGPDGQAPLFVPKGRLVNYSTYAMHRRKEYFGEDAEQFNPDRWETLRPGWEFLPFNGGPRICIGQQYALTEASYTTVRLMQQFKDIRAAETRPWVEQVMLSCCVRGGTQVILGPR